MNRAGFEEFYKKNSGLIHKVAVKGYARAAAIGCSSLDYEDIFQELTEIFIKSYDLFDPEKCLFSTYFMRAGFNHLNKILGKVEVERIENGTRSVEELSATCDDDADLVLTVEDVTSLKPESTAQLNLLLKHWRANLSPAARLLMEWTLTPPAFIEREYDAQVAYVEHCKANGIDRRLRHELDAAFICSVLRRVTGSQALFRNALSELMEMTKKTL